jgi:hypothetical protein
MQRRGPARPAGLLEAQARHLAPPLVDELAVAVGVGLEDADRSMAGERTEPRFGEPQRLLGAEPLDQVGCVPGQQVEQSPVPVGRVVRCPVVRGEHPDDHPAPALERCRLDTPVAGPGGDLAVRFVARVELHVRDDDPLPFLRGVG